MLTLLSYEPGNPHQNTHKLSSPGSVSRSWLPALLVSAQGCIVIFFVVTVLTAGSWSMQHQWAGYSVLIVSIALCAVLRLKRRSKFKTNAVLGEGGPKTTDLALSHRILRTTGMALMVLTGIAILTGWMCTLDFFWGLVWIENVHSVAAYAATALLFFFGAVLLYFKLRNELPDRSRW